MSTLPTELYLRVALCPWAGSSGGTREAMGTAVLHSEGLA